MFQSGKNLKFWLDVSRHCALPQTIIPYIFAVLLASKNYPVNYFLSMLGLIGVVLAHLGINILDDYFDWKKGAVEARKKLIDGGMRARAKKCFYLEENLIDINTALKVALGMCAFACLIGLYITLKIGLIILVIAGMTGLLGLFYSAPPIRLSYHGLGEIVVGIIFGPLLMLGAYLTAGGAVDGLILFSSIIVGLLVINILHTHAIMDFYPDKEAGRITFALLLKNQDNAIKAQAVIMILAYMDLILGVWLGFFPKSSLIALLTIPMAISLVKLMKSKNNEKKAWMGPMENWENLQKAGLDWFMLRWYLSRNLLTNFIIILSITCWVG